MKVLSWILGIIAFFVIANVVVVILSYFEVFGSALPRTREEWDTLANISGGIVGPTLSFLAIIVALITLALQREDLKKQDTENKRIQRAQEKDAKEQKRLQLLSSYEDNFFKQLTVLHDFVINTQVAIKPASKEYSTTPTYYNGYECFKHIHNSFIQAREPDQAGCIDVEKLKLDIRYTYNKNYNKFGHITGQFFRRLFRVIEYVDSLPFTLFTNETEHTTKRDELINIITSQLSVDQLALLFYNAHTNYGDKFIPLINKYSLLNGMLSHELSDKRLASNILISSNAGILTIDETNRVIIDSHLEKSNK